ncbi:MAG: tetratricopeptide repeat protein [Blastocatellia bacterium]
MADARTATEPVRIFFSYSHKDEAWRQELEKFLTPFIIQGLISNWHDRKILPGEEFDDKISENLESAHIILLFVSVDFLASAYCYGKEMKRAMERYEAGEARVIPIIVRTCVWDTAPFGKLQALPTNARPLNTWRDRDRGLTAVTNGIRDVVNSIRDSDQVKEREKISLAFYTPFNNLPPSPTPFVGRQVEADELKRFLRGEAAIIFVHGEGGTGKTRLAIEVASHLIKEFENGVCYVPLEKVSDPQLLPYAITEALKLKEVEQSKVKESLKEFLKNKQMLLLLDTFEYIASDASVEYLTDLRAACPRLKILLTSRRLVRMPGARPFKLPILALPKEEDYLPPERLSQFDAVKLFIQSSREIDPHFTITNENAPAVAQICIRLEGLALAIELVTASINRFNSNPQEMLAALENQLLSLTGGKTLKTRQTTMYASITWSYNLLNPSEQMLLRRLSIFKDGFTVTAAEAVCNPGGDLKIDVSEGLWSLVDNNLLRPDEAVKSGNRFKMSDVIREYGQELLKKSGEIEDLKRRHVNYFLSLAEEAELKITSRERDGWLERIEAELGNFRAALSWCRRAAGDCELGLRMAGALFWAWNLQANFSEGRDWLNDMLEQTRPSPHRAARAKALYAAGGLVFLQGDDKAAHPFLEDSVKMWREIGDGRGLAFALVIQGMVALNLNDLDKALACEEEAVETFARLKNRWGLALAQNDLGNVYRQKGDYAEALKLYKKSLRIWKSMNDTWGQPLTLSNLGFLDFLKGNFPSARRQLEKALKIQRAVKDKWGLSETLKYLGDLAVRRQDYSMAESLYRESLIWNRELGRKRLTVACIAGLAVTSAETGRASRALSLFDATDSLSKDVGVSVKFFDHGMYDSTKSGLYSHGGGAGVKRKPPKARAMGLEQAIAYALEIPISD